MRKGAMLIAAAAMATSAQAITFQEFRETLTDEQRRGYLIAVYDARLVEPDRAECLERMGGIRFSEEVAAFARSLPTDPNTPERRLYDGMNMALMATLVIDKACRTVKGRH